MKIKNSQKGFSLIEIMVSLALLGIIGVAFLNGLFTTSKATAVSQESVAVESLARSQMEYIKAQDYVLVITYDPGNPAYRYEVIDVPADLVGAGYTVEITPPVTIISPGAAGFELQSITVVIKRNGEGVFTLSSYRTGA